MRRLEFKYLNYLFEDIYEVKSTKYKHSKFWKKDDEVMLELEKSGDLWVLRSIWSDISNMFSLNYYETQQLIKDWMEQRLGLVGVTPNSLIKTGMTLMEQRLIYKNMKYIITENQMRKVQFKYLDYLFEDMYEVESAKYKRSKFWKKDDEVVLELEKSGDLLVLHSIWSNISNMFSLGYRETQQLMKEWVKQRLGLVRVTPIITAYVVPLVRWNNI